MSSFNAPPYDIQRSTGQCAFSGCKFEPGQAYMATLVEVNELGTASTAGGFSLKRLDVSMDAWQAGQRPEEVFCYWKTIVPVGEPKKKLFVDDEVLISLFDRLAGSDQQQRIAFRFLLALLLMRKKILKYEGSQKRPADQGDHEWWQMRLKGRDDTIDVLNPQLDEEKLQQVRDQLGQILETDA